MGGASNSILGEDAVHAAASPLQIDGRGPRGGYECRLSRDILCEGFAALQHAVGVCRRSNSLLRSETVRIRASYANRWCSSDCKAFDGINYRRCFVALNPMSGKGQPCLVQELEVASAATRFGEPFDRHYRHELSSDW